jgi:hypothetical protein
MIEEQLVNYGVLGIWTITLLVERYNSQKNLSKVINRNTECLNRVNSTISKCQKIK